MVALVLVIVIGVYYIVFDVLRFSVTSQPIAVTVVMPGAGGLYTGANVTYRGVQVGTVSALDLGTREIVAKLSIDHGEVIPDNGVVRVKELSALGEQYLDLQPSHGSGPDLANGSVISASRVILPTPIGTALVDLGRMLKSINPKDLQTFESFLATAFTGTGPGLRSIIVNGQRLFDALVAAQPETVNLIVDGQTNLKTLEATDPDFATFTKGLASLTGQLRSSNSDLKALIDNSAAAAQQLNPFLAANSPQLAAVIANLATDSRVSNEFQPEVRAIFQLLPVVSDDLAAVAGGGHVHGILEINTADTVCPYILGSQMPGPTEKVSNAPLTSSCGSTAPDMLQRGAASTPAFPGG
jgi:phospholipid/cholesterol/gamma-HCH transport system substrate-binding protein